MARAKKTTKVENEAILETVLWNCRVVLRGIGSLEKNRDAVIGLVFLKFAGDKFEKRRAELLNQYKDDPNKDIYLDQPAFYTRANTFYLPENCRWQQLKDGAGKSGLEVRLDNAMKDIQDKNPPLNGALQSNLYSTLGASQSKLKSLLDEVDKIRQENYPGIDLIGRTYEYFLQVYAASGTKENGEFYTPKSAVKLIAELIEPYSGIVYDPCCGSGGMFVQSLKFVESHNGNSKNISILGQESNPATWQLARMNLASRGISCNLGQEAISTFEKDEHANKKVNYVMANPPFNLKDWQTATQTGETPDARFTDFGMPTNANANYAWILHILSKLDVNNGVAGFLLSNGALNASGIEYEIRKKLLLEDRVDAIIVLPRDMFYTTDISVTLWILNMNKKAQNKNGQKLRDRRKEVLFVDLRQWAGNIQEIVIDKGKKKKKNYLTDEQIAKVKAIYEDWKSADPERNERVKDIPELCRAVPLTGPDSIQSHDYALTPSSYIRFIDHDLDIDYPQEMARIQAEMKDILKQEKTSQKMLEDAFRGIGYGIE